MGRDKALITIDGVAMAVRVAAALRAAGAVEVVAIGGDAAALHALGLDVRPDDQPGDGPLPATITALRATPQDVTVVAPCDLLRPDPNAFAQLVGALATAPNAVGAVAVVDDQHQWATMAWRSSALRGLEAAYFAGARSLRRAAPILALVEVADLDPAAFADADEPRDLPAGAALASQEMADVPEIDVHELATQRAAGAPLIDVREPDEYAEARVAGANLIPLGEVADRVDEVPRDGTVYVICARGGRSAKAVEHYRSLGIDAVNVAGGTLGWIAAGLPTDRDGESEAGSG